MNFRKAGVTPNKKKKTHKPTVKHHIRHNFHQGGREEPGSHAGHLENLPGSHTLTCFPPLLSPNKTLGRNCKKERDKWPKEKRTPQGCDSREAAGGQRHPKSQEGGLALQPRPWDWGWVLSLLGQGPDACHSAPCTMRPVLAPLNALSSSPPPTPPAAVVYKYRVQPKPSFTHPGTQQQRAEAAFGLKGRQAWT